MSDYTKLKSQINTWDLDCDQQLFDCIQTIQNSIQKDINDNQQQFQSLNYAVNSIDTQIFQAFSNIQDISDIKFCEQKVQELPQLDYSQSEQSESQRGEQVSTLERHKLALKLGYEILNLDIESNEPDDDGSQSQSQSQSQFSLRPYGYSANSFKLPAIIDTQLFYSCKFLGLIEQQPQQEENQPTMDEDLEDNSKQTQNKQRSYTTIQPEKQDIEEFRQAQQYSLLEKAQDEKRFTTFVPNAPFTLNLPGQQQKIDKSSANQQNDKVIQSEKKVKEPSRQDLLSEIQRFKKSELIILDESKKEQKESEQKPDQQENISIQEKLNRQLQERFNKNAPQPIQQQPQQNNQEKNPITHQQTQNQQLKIDVQEQAQPKQQNNQIQTKSELKTEKQSYFLISDDDQDEENNNSLWKNKLTKKKINPINQFLVKKNKVKTFLDESDPDDTDIEILQAQQLAKKVQNNLKNDIDEVFIQEIKKTELPNLDFQQKNTLQNQQTAKKLPDLCFMPDKETIVLSVAKNKSKLPDVSFGPISNLDQNFESKNQVKTANEENKLIKQSKVSDDKNKGLPSLNFPIQQKKQKPTQLFSSDSDIDAKQSTPVQQQTQEKKNSPPVQQNQYIKTTQTVLNSLGKIQQRDFQTVQKIEEQVQQKLVVEQILEKVVIEQIQQKVVLEQIQENPIVEPESPQQEIQDKKPDFRNSLNNLLLKMNVLPKVIVQKNLQQQNQGLTKTTNEIKKDDNLNDILLNKPIQNQNKKKRTQKPLFSDDIEQITQPKQSIIQQTQIILPSYEQKSQITEIQTPQIPQTSQILQIQQQEEVTLKNNQELTLKNTYEDIQKIIQEPIQKIIDEPIKPQQQQNTQIQESKNNVSKNFPNRISNPLIPQKKVETNNKKQQLFVDSDEDMFTRKTFPHVNDSVKVTQALEQPKQVQKKKILIDSDEDIFSQKRKSIDQKNPQRVESLKYEQKKVTKKPLKSLFEDSDNDVDSLF